MPAAGPLSPHGPQRPTAAPKRPAPASHAVPDPSEVDASSKEATIAGLVALPRPRSEPSKERRDRLSPPRRICHPAPAHSSLPHVHVSSSQRRERKKQAYLLSSTNWPYRAITSVFLRSIGAVCVLTVLHRHKKTIKKTARDVAIIPAQEIIYIYIYINIYKNQDRY